MVIGSTGRTSDYLQADEEWYQKAVSEEEFWVGDVEYDESSETFATDIVASLYDDSGNYVGIFKGVLNVEHIKTTVTRMQARSPFESMTPYLVDKSGLVLFSGLDPDQKRLGRDVKLHEFGEDVSCRGSVAEAVEGRDGFLVSVEERASGEERLLSAFSPSTGFKEFKGLGWALIVEYETSDILGPVTEVKNFLLVVSSMSVGVALVVAVIVARSISISIKRLTEVAEGISSGNMEAKIEKVEGRDEIGRLGSAFNTMSAKLKESYEGLEQRVKERTTELEQAKNGLETEIVQRKRAEAKLERQAQELARSNGELEQFASVASHDLQEPLRKIQAFGDMLRNRGGQALGDQARDYLGRMQDAAERMQALINDLLTFSRVTTRAQPFVPVDLGKLTMQVLSDLEVSIERAGGSVEVGVLPTIEADPTQMRQLLQNLISNGLKFHRPGVSPCVSIRGQLVDGRVDRQNGDSLGDRLLELTVEDNGIGFEEKYLDRIFAVFQRLQGRGAYEGSGLGLAICRKIVERHRGHITAKSAPAQGSTFIVTLPVSQPEGESVPWMEFESQLRS